MKFWVILVLPALFSCKDSDTTVSIPTGGYDYPKNIETRDSGFYFYPIKNLESPRDSLLDAFYSSKFFPIYKEPNLSLRPKDHEIYRLTYFSGNGYMPEYIIAISNNLIIVKKTQQTTNEYVDNMTELERLFVDVFLMNFPIKKNNKKIKKSRQHYLDSLINIYPKLLEPDYYRYLMDKMYTLYEKLYTYSTSEIAIFPTAFRELISTINKSGYWQLPFEYNCKDVPTDAGTFVLEANTKTKYNVVKTPMCGDSHKYLDAIKEIIKVSEIEDLFLLEN